METTHIHSFSFRIKEGAYEEMIRILRFPQVTSALINGQVCRVTSTHDLQLSLKTEFWTEYADDTVLQVRLMEHPERDFIVMRSMMKEVPEVV
jgi:hypothetical protein